jgi:hypothetical protein
LKTGKAYANALHSLLGSLEEVRSIRIIATAASVIISYTPDIPEVEFARKALKAIQEGFYVAQVY